MDGAVQGAEAVRTIVLTIRTLYEHQEFNFAGPYGDNGFLEDYAAQVRGEPIGCVVLVTRNAAGQTQHVVANYRPRSSLLLLSRLLARSSPAPPLPSTSSPASPETDNRLRIPSSEANEAGV